MLGNPTSAKLKIKKKQWRKQAMPMHLLSHFPWEVQAVFWLIGYRFLKIFLKTFTQQFSFDFLVGRIGYPS